MDCAVAGPGFYWRDSLNKPRRSASGNKESCRRQPEADLDEQLNLSRSRRNAV